MVPREILGQQGHTLCHETANPHPMYLSTQHSELLNKACDAYVIDQTPSARFWLVAVLRAIQDINQIEYDEDAMDESVRHAKTLLKDPE